MVHVRGAKRIIHDSIQVASVLSVISRLRPTNCSLMTRKLVVYVQSIA